MVDELGQHAIAIVGAGARVDSNGHRGGHRRATHGGYSLVPDVGG